MVTMYLQLLERRCASRLEKEDLEYIGHAVSGARRMKELVEALLEYAHAGRGDIHFVRVELARVLEQAKEDLSAAIKESHASIVAGNLPVVRADPFQVRQLLQNLLSNAIKYRSDRPPEIGVTAHCDGGQCVVSIRDNGIGFKQEYADRIFEVFQRLHNDRDRYPGTGLGLAICKRIVERHDGHIWVESAPGRGSTFHFSIPS